VDEMETMMQHQFQDEPEARQDIDEIDKDDTK
jgi:hypothetical protein